MTRNDAKELLPIITAFAEGKTIQIKSTHGWEDLKPSVSFVDDPSNYRIKPEPRRFWVNLYPADCGTIWSSKEVADEMSYSVSFGSRVECIEVVEVLTKD
jgi:hypothetical protein